MGARPSDEYLCGWTVLANHHLAAELDQALAVTRAMLERHPDRLAALSHAEACLLASTGRIDAAVDVMRRVVDQDRGWSMRQLADTDLGPMMSRRSPRCTTRCGTAPNEPTPRPSPGPRR